MLLVHAHPDDETIATGATMAKYVAQGSQVTLVTCTLGEEGEVLIPELAHLASDRDDQLGPQRRTELADAMAVLGVTDHRLLGGPGRYRDSGMQWHPDGHAAPLDETREDTFWHADLLEAASHLVEVIREVRPQVLVTYDEFGGYGHPDHIQAHRVAMYAVDLAGVRTFRPDLGGPWSVSKIYWAANSARWARDGIHKMRIAGDDSTFAGFDPDKLGPPMFHEDEDIDTLVDGSAFAEAKVAALLAHRTQITEDNDFVRLRQQFGDEALGFEHFRLVRGVKGPVGASGFEEDLFAGLEAESTPASP